MEIGKEQKNNKKIKAEVQAKESLERVVLKRIFLLKMLLKDKLRCGHRNNN